jgi:dynein heavy chain 1, cytosolic
LVDLDGSALASSKFIPVFAGTPLPVSFRSAVVDFCLFAHRAAIKTNQHLKNQPKILICPSHFLEFVINLVNTYHEKRSQVEKRQRHLIVGLERLQETFHKVEELRASLADKKEELERKTTEANEKLKKMVNDQQQAEQNRFESVKLQKALTLQNSEIVARRKVVMSDLSMAEPAGILQLI